MTVSLAATPPRLTGPDDVPTEPIFRLSVAQYHAMTKAGILTEDDPVELLEGWLVRKMPKNPPHVFSTDTVAEKIDALKPPGWHVKRQDPITTADSEPEPDVMLIRGTRRAFLNRHPSPGDLALVVEVADSTLQRDRTTKMRAYANAGITVYWILNLVDRTVEVYTNPTGPSREPAYRDRFDHQESDTITVILDGRTLGDVAVRDLLP